MLEKIHNDKPGINFLHANKLEIENTTIDNSVKVPTKEVVSMVVYVVMDQVIYDMVLGDLNFISCDIELVKVLDDYVVMLQVVVQEKRNQPFLAYTPIIMV